MSASSIESDPEAARSLLRALRHTGISLLYQDRDLHVVWAQNVPASWSVRQYCRLDRLRIPAVHVAERVTAAKRAVLSAANPDRIEISIPECGRRALVRVLDRRRQSARTAKFAASSPRRSRSPSRSAASRPCAPCCAKSAIARRTCSPSSRASPRRPAAIRRRSTASCRAFAAACSRWPRRRIWSPRPTGAAPTFANWSSARSGATSPTPRSAIRFEGESPCLNPNAALHIGLALHELAVNSVSYGALSKPEGTITVAARLNPGPPGETALSLTWSETIGAPSDDLPDPATRERRFGSVALERVVPASLNGSASLTLPAASSNTNWSSRSQISRAIDGARGSPVRALSKSRPRSRFLLRPGQPRGMSGAKDRRGLAALAARPGFSRAEIGILTRRRAIFPTDWVHSCLHACFSGTIVRAGSFSNAEG